MTVLDQSVPIWNQLNDPDSEGHISQQARESCGFECAAMVKYATDTARPNWAQDSIREMYRGWNSGGLTTGDELQQVLAKMDVPSHVRPCAWYKAWVEIGHSIAASMPTIVLGLWDGPFLHWMVAVGPSQPGQDHLIFHDPWGGRVHQVSRADFIAQYAGQYVHVDTKAV